MRARLKTNVTGALQPVGWAARFYARHLPLVVGLSLIPAVQRYVSVLYDLPDPVALLLEMITLAARVLLVVLIVRLGIARDPSVTQVPPPERGRNAGAFLRERWGSLAIGVCLLGAAAAFFDLFLEGVVPHRLPIAHDTYLAWLLAVKNPTVIAFTIVWIVGVVRQALIHTPADRRTATHAPAADRRATPGQGIRS